MEVCRRDLDVVVLVLGSAHLGGQHRAPVDVLEVAVGELVVSLGLGPALVVAAQVPGAEVGPAVLGDG
jgi:hypothetical protein